MGLYSPIRDVVPNDGQIGNCPDYGTYKSGYDYVNLPQDNPVDIYDRFKFSPIQLTIIERSLKTNPVFKQAMLNNIRKIINENPDLTRDQLKNKIKSMFIAGTIAMSAVASPSWMNAFAATGNNTNNIPSKQDIKTAVNQYKFYKGDVSKLTSKEVDTLKWIQNNKSELLKVKDQVKSLDQKSNNQPTISKNNIIDTKGFSPEFINYIKTVENAGKTGKQGKLWFPHKSPEGGKMTIGYGHKLTSNDEQSNKVKNGLTDNEIEYLLIKDLNNAKSKVYNDLQSMYGKCPNLTQKQEEMLIDFAYNLGTIKGFPKFTKAVLNNDINTMRQEYERSYKDADGNRQKLTGRNNAFYNTFLK